MRCLGLESEAQIALLLPVLQCLALLAPKLSLARRLFRQEHVYLFICSFHTSFKNRKRKKKGGWVDGDIESVAWLGGMERVRGSAKVLIYRGLGRLPAVRQRHLARFGKGIDLQRIRETTGG